MSRLYLIANSYGRFHSELGIAGEGFSSPSCEACAYPVTSPPAILKYFWDTGFGSPDRAIRNQHDIFWCEFAILASAATVDRALSADVSIEAVPADCVASDEAASRYGIRKHHYDLPLMWLRPLIKIDVAGTRYPICRKCGKFGDEAWRVTRLEVRRRDLPRHGVFQITQNRGFPSFVTEEGRNAIVQTGLRGVSFYPAGRVID
jgi:hypothetical protein